MAAGGGSKAVVAALVGNTAIAVAKFIGWGLTGASSLLAEAIHSVADAGNQGLLLWGNRASRRSADAEHQFGYGRERYFWAFIVAVVLFLLGSVFALYEGIQKILHPHELDSLYIAYGILGFAMVAEGFTLRTAVKEANPLRGDMSWWQFVRRTRNPELPVVLLEDLGALIGLVLATTALTIAKLADDPVWDGIGTASIGVLLFFIAVTLIVEMRSLLIGEGATPKEMTAIRLAIEDADGVEHLIHLRTQYLSPEELLVGAKVSFTSDLTMSELADAVNALEEDVRAVVPHARPMYIEPDLHRASGTWSD